MPNSSKMLQAIFESSVAGIICIDSDGLMTEFSPAAERIFGYRADEVIGRNVSLLMPEPDHSRHDGYLANYAHTGKAAIIGIGREVTGLRKDGTTVPLFLSVGEFEIDGRKMFSGIVSDQSAVVAERRALQDSERRFRQLAESIDEVFLLRTVEPVQILYLNPAVESILGVTPEAGMTDPAFLTALVHPDDLDVVRDASVEAASGGEPSVEFRIVRADGEVRWLWIRYRQVAVEAGEPALLAVVLSDVTDRKLAVESAALARQEAERANAAKSEFLSRMSHELRTPLNAILGFAQLMEMDDPSPVQRDSLAQVSKAGRHLLDLINDVLDIARIDAGQLSLSLEPVATCDVVQAAVDLVLPMIEARGLTMMPLVAGPDAGCVFADRRRVTQTLLNLLSNAVKYNREGGWIAVTCEARPDGTTAITVADSGVGIDPKAFDRVFAPFDRLGQESTSIEGIGIGLALTSSLVRAMNGRVEVQSNPGSGSSFSVVLPSVQCEDGEGGTSDGANSVAGHDLESSEHAHKELVVVSIEDNPANMRLMESVAARRPGVRLLQAQQGRLGLDLIESSHPDLILLDLHLPDVPGQELLRILRGNPRTASTPILIVSADASPGLVDRLVAMGASGYLSKPFEVAEILAWFDRLQADLEDGGKHG